MVAFKATEVSDKVVLYPHIRLFSPLINFQYPCRKPCVLIISQELRWDQDVHLFIPSCLLLTYWFVDRQLKQRLPACIEFSKTYATFQVRCQTGVNRQSFSAGMSPSTSRKTLGVCHVQHINESSIYMGHPLILPSKDRSSAYNFVANKFKGKLSGYKANKLSHSTRLILINLFLFLHSCLLHVKHSLLQKTYYKSYFHY
jgi:hypothetical protein